jgi:LCP family protein required for cell wall assembly
MAGTPPPDADATERAGSSSVGRDATVAVVGRRRRRTVGQRLLLVANCLVALSCFVAAGLLYFGKYTRENFLAAPLADPVVSTPDTTAVPETDPITGELTESTVPLATFPQADPRARNFLIAGESNNACVDPGSPWADAGDPNRQYAELSDTIMVIRVDPASNGAAVLSFQRDLRVDIAGRGSRNRINTAYKKNDPTRLAQTIFDNFGIAVDHYIQVDFCAFKKIVDAVGGVSVPFATPIRDPKVRLFIPQAGCHRFSGDEALAYVRTRSLQFQQPDGEWVKDQTVDFGRVSRQQDFIRRVLQAVEAKGLFNYDVASSLIDSMRTFVVTDTNFSLDQMLEFAGVMRNVDPTALASYQIEARSIVVGGASMLEPRLEGDNMQAILAIFRGEAPLATAPPQVFDTTTTVADASGSAGSDPDVASSETTAAETISTDAQPVGSGQPAPVENTQGVIPDRNVSCP